MRLECHCNKRSQELHEYNGYNGNNGTNVSRPVSAAWCACCPLLWGYKTLPRHWDYCPPHSATITRQCSCWRQPGDQSEAGDDSGGGTGGMLDHAGLSLVHLSPHSAGSDPEYCDVNLGWFGQSQCPGQSVLDTYIASLNRFYSQPPGLSSLDTEIQKLTCNFE